MAPPSDAGGAHRRSHRVEQRRVGIPRDCCLPHDFHGKICFYEQTLADDSDLDLAERAALTRPEAPDRRVGDVYVLSQRLENDQLQRPLNGNSPASSRRGARKNPLGGCRAAAAHSAAEARCKPLPM